MIDILADGNFPFTVALVLMLALGLLEGASLLFGISVGAALDSIIPDVDLPGVDGVGEHPGHMGPLAHLFSWFSVGRVPALILLVLFLTCFGLSGYAIQSAWQAATGSMLDAGVASAPAALAGLVGMGRLGALVARILPKDETYAPSRQHLLGAVATVIRGEARLGHPAEAKARDLNGNLHYFLLEPQEEGVTLFAGDTAVLLRNKPGTAVYQAVTEIPPTKDKHE